jgi:predicted DNA-binding protein (MmcQ/YjbR family)
MDVPVAIGYKRLQARSSCQGITMPSKGYEQALKRVRSICLALPESQEVEAWGHPTFRAGKKMFAVLSEDHVGPALHLKVGFDRQDELLEDKRFYPTPYSAHQGWVSLHVDGKTDWDEMNGLILESYRQVALKRMLKALEA